MLLQKLLERRWSQTHSRLQTEISRTGNHNGDNNDENNTVNRGLRGRWPHTAPPRGPAEPFLGHSVAALEHGPTHWNRTQRFSRGGAAACPAAQCLREPHTSKVSWILLQAPISMHERGDGAFPTPASSRLPTRASFRKAPVRCPAFLWTLVSFSGAWRWSQEGDGCLHNWLLSPTCKHAMWADSLQATIPTLATVWLPHSVATRAKYTATRQAQSRQEVLQ